MQRRSIGRQPAADGDRASDPHGDTRGPSRAHTSTQTGPTRHAGGLLVIRSRVADRVMGDPDRRLQEPKPGARGGGGGSCRSAGATPLRDVRTAADGAIRQYGALPRPPRPSIGERGFGRLYAPQPPPTALCRCAAERLLSKELSLKRRLSAGWRMFRKEFLDAGARRGQSGTGLPLRDKLAIGEQLRQLL